MSDYYARGHSPPRPGRNHDDEQSSPVPVTACRRCRKQKLRCSRELPACKRCKDIYAVCEYPPPPDRKLLAAQRQNARARAHRESEGASGLQDQRRLSEVDGSRGVEAAPVQYNSFKPSESIEEPDQGQSPHNEYQVSSPLHTALKRTNMPSSEVAMFLIEIYFARLYNAHLLFHKESFLADFAAHKVPDFVALGIFASASIFLRQTPGKAQQLVGRDGDSVGFGLSVLSAADWTRQGDDWANAACQRALIQADSPRVEVVQACQCLGLYWWAIGKRERTHINSHIAYMNARLLGLHVQSDDPEDSFTGEVRRRLFWACWMNQCIGQENASFKAEPWKDAIGLKLPCDDESWRVRRPRSKEMFNDKGNIVNIDGSEVTPIPSHEGENIKLLGLWWEAQRFLNQPGEGTVHNASSKLAGLYELDYRLNSVFENLHPHLRYVNATTFTSPKVDKYRLFALHTLYRSTSCALHSSIVPLFANTVTNPYVSKRAVRLAAEEAVKHSAAILDMATAFMGSSPVISRLPSMVGFAMFVASTIQFKSLNAQRKLQTFGTGRFRAAIIILDRLKEYWDSLQGLWMSLGKLFAPAGINIDAIPTDPRFQLNSGDQNTDLDKIVSQEGTPASCDTAVLYTYVATQEAKSDASPRHSSDVYTQSRMTKSAHNTPSPGSGAIQVEGAEHTLPIHQRQDGQIQPIGQVYATLQQHPGTRPRTQSFESQPPIAGSIAYRRESISATGGNSFIPLRTVPEDYQAPASSVGMSYRAMPGETPGVQSMGAFGSMPGTIDNEMDVDRMNFWWDQSYGTFDMEVIDPNVSIGGDGNQSQNFSFGSGF